MRDLKTLLIQGTAVIDWNSSTVIRGIARGMLEQTAVILFWTGCFPYKYLLYRKTDSYCSSDLEKKKWEMTRIFPVRPTSKAVTEYTYGPILHKIWAQPVFRQNFQWSIFSVNFLEQSSQDSHLPLANLTHSETCAWQKWPSIPLT